MLKIWKNLPLVWQFHVSITLFSHYPELSPHISQHLHELRGTVNAFRTGKVREVPLRRKQKSVISGSSITGSRVHYSQAMGRIVVALSWSDLPLEEVTVVTSRLHKMLSRELSIVLVKTWPRSWRAALCQRLNSSWLSDNVCFFSICTGLDLFTFFFIRGIDKTELFLGAELCRWKLINVYQH